MKIRIVVCYVPRYRHGHRWHFVPPLTGIHLAALTPARHQVELIHEQVRPVPIAADVDLVALSFFSGFARHAYQLADAYRRLGVRVVAGGPHVSYWTDDALQHFDAVVVGEAESAWPRLLEDAAAGALQPIYRGPPPSLAGLPVPRYDLIEPRFVVPHVIQATRGCPFRCRFCSVPDLNPGFRTRPLAEVVRDIVAPRFAHGWQNKVVWFWDDNLLAPRRWAKQLLGELARLDRWWLTQASIDIVRDRELMRLLQRSGCIGIFLGIESLEPSELRGIDKRPNQAAAYRDAVRALHDLGICVMAGVMAGLDGQTPRSIVDTAARLDALEFDVPFLSIVTPFRGTALYGDWLRQGRILLQRDWPHYNGYNVAFRPQGMSPDELLAAHRELWRRAFAPAAAARRIGRGVRQLSPGGLLLSSAMNGFYGLKAWTDGLPADAPLVAEGTIAHPPAAEAESCQPIAA
ncbi:MAG: B12-binding domain-containing radical SAM protein [Deltaproteobacteria bacterium]|nr:B12-binding domain-containing radical SAM protein [Deltaproteobacteria bacterium]